VTLRSGVLIILFLYFAQKHTKTTSLEGMSIRLTFFDKVGLSKLATEKNLSTFINGNRCNFRGVANSNEISGLTRIQNDKVYFSLALNDDLSLG